MKTTLQKMISIFSFIFALILIVTALQATAAEKELIDNITQNSSSVTKQGIQALPDMEKKHLTEEPTFHKLFKDAKENLNLIGNRLVFVFSHYSEVPEEIVKALNQLSGEKGLWYSAKIFFLFLLPIVLGLSMERLINTAINKYKQQLQSTVPKSFVQLTARLSARTALELISFTVFAFTIIGLALLFYPIQSPLFELALIYLPTIFIIRIAYIILNVLYSPTTPHMRITPQDCSAASMYLIGLMTFIIISLFATKTLFLFKSHGMSEGVFLFLYSILGLVQFVILLAIVWKDRARISRSVMKAQDTKDPQSPPFKTKIIAMWFPLSCIGIFGFELLWQVNLILHNKDLILPLLLTILSIPFGFLLFSIGNHLLLIASGQTELMDPRIVNEDILPKDADISQFIEIDLPPEPVSLSHGDNASDLEESLLVRHLALIRNLMSLLIACTLFSWIMNLWGLDMQLGRTVVQSALSIFTTLLLAYVIWEICRTIIDRKLEADKPKSEQNMEDVEEGAEGSRKGTLLTLLRKVIIVFIGVVVVLTTLNSIGINIKPLLAGAGILGIAVGFGSQTLVRDILSGVFFLMDDAFRVGDYIETAGTKGMVEYISLRSLRLRHPRGMVYTIPFGDMGSVQNFSRDYIITKLDIRVRYDANIEKIRKIVKKLGRELALDEEIGPLLLNPIKSQGVREMDDSAMILRVKFKTKPGDQFVVRREVYRNIQERFRAEGIEFAHRNVTVYLPSEVNEDTNDDKTGENSASSAVENKKLIGAGAAATLAALQAEGPKPVPGR